MPISYTPPPAPLANSLDPSRIEAFPRLLISNSVSLTSGTAMFTYFTPTRRMTVGNIVTFIRGTAAATVTTSKVGLYTVAANGDLTCIARSANTTGLWTPATPAVATAPIADDGAASPGAISTVEISPAQRYAIGLLFVGTTAPQPGISNVGGGTLNALAPRLAAAVSAQTDLLSSYASGSLSALGSVIWAAVTA